MRSQRSRVNPQPFVHIAALLPLLWVVGVLLIKGLGVNPIQYLEKRLGDYGLALLLACLACTPLRILTGNPHFTQFRRPLGLYAFAYASLHLLLFVGLDYGFVIRQVVILILQKTYLWLGLSAFIFLLLLAVTSTQRSQKRLKKNWLRLHMLIYPAALLVVLHYALSVKGNLFLLRGEILLPLSALIILTVLMLFRLSPVRALILRLRK